MKDILKDAIIEGQEERVRQLTNALREVTDQLAKREQLISELRTELRAKETAQESARRSLARMNDIITKRLAELKERGAK